MTVLFDHVNPLEITKRVARIINHPGDCTHEIISMMQLPEIKRQLNKVAPKNLIDELREYGAWSEEELQNHEDNLQRILWIACCNINEKNI